MSIEDKSTRMKLFLGGAHLLGRRPADGASRRLFRRWTSLSAAAPPRPTVSGSGSGHPFERRLHSFPNFRRALPLPPRPPKLPPKHLPLQRLAPTRMRRAPPRFAPRRVAAVAQLSNRLSPGPPSHSRVPPQTPVDRPLVGPPVTQLLLACPLYLFDVF